MWNKCKHKLMILLSAGLILTGCGSSETTVTPLRPQEAESQTETQKPLPENYTALVPGSKSETVSVKANAAGTPQSTSVEVTLSEFGDAEYIEDLSTLMDIRNVTGAEEFYLLEDHKVIWENLHEDIQYKGISQESLPVAVSITYELNGTPIDPNDLAGQSGHVTMHIRYRNDTLMNVTVDGITYTLPSPMLAITMVPLSDHFSHVTVDNGKVIQLSDSDAVIGFAVPGLAESLKLQNYELTRETELPEDITIEADVEAFELEFTTTILSSGLFEELDEDDLSDASELSDDMNKLQDASGKLVDGTGELYDGMKEFEDYLSQYNDGIGKVGDGISQLESGLSTINGYSSDLNKGAKAVSDGLGQLNESVKNLSLDQLITDETKVALTGLITALSADVVNMQTTVNTLKTSYETSKNYYDVIKAYYDSVKGIDDKLTELQNISHTALTDDEKTAILNEFADESESALKTKVSEMLNYYSRAPVLVDEIKTSIASLTEPPEDPTEQLTALNTAIATTQDHLTALITALETIQAAAGAVAGLPEMINGLKTGVAALASGSAKLTDGLSSYTDGVAKLYEGASALKEGAGKLPEAGSALREGYTSILSGVNELRDGVIKFDREGIRELGKLGGSQLQDIVRRVKALHRIEGETKGFSGVPEGTTASVRYIIETEEIKASE